MTFEAWLEANNHMPTNWQTDVVRAWDSQRTGVYVATGKRWGKTWLLDRWREYEESQA